MPNMEFDVYDAFSNSLSPPKGQILSQLLDRDALLHAKHNYACNCLFYCAELTFCCRKTTMHWLPSRPFYEACLRQNSVDTGQCIE